jgi:hypothetical protein
MSHETVETATDEGPQDVATRAAWTRPELMVIRSADAELGANPIIPEGAFAFGS